MTKSLQSMRKNMLSDREVRASYDAMADEFSLSRELIAARVRAGLTQAELAARMGTTQSVVARLESGAQLPSVKTLLRFAKATGARPVIKLLAA
jgi:ribosome-binding protein aMBF1 (putative translation factor)